MGDDEERGGGLVRGVAGIVLLGVALGLAFNALQLASGPRHGLAWIKREVKLASLESMTGVADAVAADSSGATPPPHTDRVATTPAATRKSPARADSTRANVKGAKPTKGARPGPAATAAVGATASRAGVPAASAPPAADTTSKVANLPAVPDTREPLEVKYATIKKFWDAGAALFVDARSAAEYAEGHIPGAVNLPFDDVFRNPDKAKALDTKGRAIIITYCGGGDCDLSRNLAFSLIDAGRRKVLVFLDGVPGWKEGGNALVTGSSPGSAP